MIARVSWLLRSTADVSLFACLRHISTSAKGCKCVCQEDRIARNEIEPELNDLSTNVPRSDHVPMDIVYEQEILVITYLFPESKYDMLMMNSAKADFYSSKYEFCLPLE